MLFVFSVFAAAPTALGVHRALPLDIPVDAVRSLRVDKPWVVSTHTFGDWVVIEGQREGVTRVDVTLMDGTRESMVISVSPQGPSPVSEGMMEIPENGVVTVDMVGVDRVGVVDPDCLRLRPLGADTIALAGPICSTDVIFHAEGLVFVSTVRVGGEDRSLDRFARPERDEVKLASGETWYLPTKTSGASIADLDVVFGQWDRAGLRLDGIDPGVTDMAYLDGGEVRVMRFRVE